MSVTTPGWLARSGLSAECLTRERPVRCRALGEAFELGATSISLKPRPKHAEYRRARKRRESVTPTSTSSRSANWLCHTQCRIPVPCLQIDATVSDSPAKSLQMSQLLRAGCVDLPNYYHSVAKKRPASNSMAEKNGHDKESNARISDFAVVFFWVSGKFVQLVYNRHVRFNDGWPNLFGFEALQGWYWFLE